MQYRIEKDSMGEVRVPEDARYGASTQRAIDNFPISGRMVGRRIVEAFGLLKGSAATVAGAMGHIDAAKATASPNFSNNYSTLTF